MSQHAGSPTLLDLCKPLRPVGSNGNGSDGSIVDRDVDGAPIHRRASSVMEEAPPRGLSRTHTKASGCLPSTTAAVAASPLARRSTAHVTASPHGSYGLGAESGQSPDAGGLARPSLDGVTMSAAPLHLLQRRGTLPFLGHDPSDTADTAAPATAAAVDGGAVSRTATADGATRSPSGDSQCDTPRPPCGADGSAAGTGGLLRQAGSGSGAVHEQLSMTDDAWPSMAPPASHDDSTASATGAATVRTAGGILAAEQNFASLGSQWQPSSGFDEAAAAAATAHATKSAPQSWELASADGRLLHDSDTQMLSNTISQHIAHLVPSRRGSATSTTPATVPLLLHRLSLSTLGGGSSATTAPLNASISALRNEGACSRDEFPDIGGHFEHDDNSASHSHRGPTRISEYGTALDASTNAAGSTLPAVTELSSNDLVKGPLSLPPFQGAAETPAADVRLVVPLGRVAPRALPLHDIVAEERTDFATELNASSSSPLPPSATRLLGARDGHIAVVRGAVHHVPRDGADSGASAVQDAVPLRRHADPAAPHVRADAAGEGEGEAKAATDVRLAHALPAPQRLGSPCTDATASPSPRSPCSRRSSPPSPPFVRLQRRSTLAAPTELLLLRQPSSLPAATATAPPITVPAPSGVSGGGAGTEDDVSVSAAVAARMGRGSTGSLDSLSLHPSDSCSRVGPAVPPSARALQAALFPEPTAAPRRTTPVEVPQSRLGKLVGWVHRKYHDVVQPAGDGGAEAGSSAESSTKVAPPSCRGAFGLPPLALSLSFGAVAGPEAAESRPATPRQAPGNGSWFAVGSRADHRSGVRGTSGLLQLRRSLKPQFAATSSQPASPWEGSTSSPPLPNMSFSQRSPSGPFDAMAGSQFSNDSAVLRLSRSISGGGTLNGSISLSGDQRSLSLPSSPAQRSQLTTSRGSSTADDHYRELLYHLFHHPPSSRMGDLSECYAAYTAMVETSSNGHHVLNWGELGLLLRPEDYIDYRSLYPLYHFVSFDDFVEFVEILSVRHRE